MTDSHSSRPVILHVLHTLRHGGAEVLVRDLVNAQRDQYRSVVVALDERGCIAHQLHQAGAAVYCLNRTPGIDLHCAAVIRHLAVKHHAAIIHAHQYTPWFYATLAAWPTPHCRVIFHEHGRHYPDHRSTKRVVANRLALLPRTQRVLAVGAFIADALQQNEAIPRRRIRVIHNGIDPTPFVDRSDAQRMKIRQQLGLDNSHLIALHVGRFSPVKDHTTAIRALSLAMKQRPNLHGLFAGTGPLLPTARALAQEMAVSDRIQFLGDRTDIPDLLAAADLFLLSSVSEGISVALLEAMAAARPVVATDVGGNSELVEHHHTGLLVPRADHAQLANAIIQLAQHPEQRYAMGAAGRQKMREQFTRRRMHQQIHQVYTELLNAT